MFKYVPDFEATRREMSMKRNDLIMIVIIYYKVTWLVAAAGS